MSTDDWFTLPEQTPQPIIDMTEIESALLARLRSDNVVVDDVWAYLEYQDRSDKQVSYFFTRQDMEHYRAACTWWPEADDMPIDLRRPRLEQLCFNYADPAGETFMDRLTFRANRAAAWAEANIKKPGRPRLHKSIPGETDYERQKRLGREATARHREKLLAQRTPQQVAYDEARLAVATARKLKRAAMADWDNHIAALEGEVLRLKLEMK